ASVTVTGSRPACATPASCSCTESGPEGVPAASVTGALTRASPADHVAKLFHPSLKAAPGSDSVQVPVHAAAGADAESWIAATRRSAIAPVSLANSVELIPLGAC